MKLLGTRVCTFKHLHILLIYPASYDTYLYSHQTCSTYPHINFISAETSEKTLYSTPVRTHGFLNDTIIIWCIIRVHWFQEGPGHLVGLQRKKKKGHSYCQVEILIHANTLLELCPKVLNWIDNIVYTRGVKLIFTRGHISLTVTFKGPNVILGLYKCNYSLTWGKEFGATTR